MEIKDQLLRVWLPAQSLLVVVSTITCGVLLAQTTWSIIESEVDIQAPKITAAGSNAQNGTNWLQFSREITKRAFFGQVAQEEEAAPVDAVDAPETRLAFTLQAVMAQGEGSGYAVIAQRSGSGKVFGVGDDLYGQASLSAVYGDRVVIDRGGQLEILRYEQPDASAMLKSITSREEDYEIDSFQDVYEQANEAVAQGGNVQSQVQEMMDYVSQKASENPEAFINEMGLEATAGGYQVTRRARQLQMVGLRPGDIVTAVNDTPVGNIAMDQVLLSQIMQTGGEVKIQIKRGTRSFTIYQSIPTF